MFRYLLGAALALVTTAHAAGLDDLAFLAGNCWSAAGEPGQTETHCYRFLYGDRFLEDELTVSAGDQPIYRGTTVYRSDHEGRVHWIYFGQSGGWMEGQVERDGDDLVVPPADWVGPGGSRITMRVRWSELARDSFRSETRTLIDGSWVLTSSRDFRRGLPSESPAGAFLFKSRRDGDDELYRWADGAVTRLTDRPGPDHWPSPSPDGEQVVWFRVEDGIRNLYVGRLVSGDLVSIEPFSPSPSQDLLPAWSPAGGQIAFFSSREEGGIGPEGLLGHVYVAEVAGDRMRRVSDEILESTAISWRPDGGALAYARSGRIFLAELSTGEEAELPVSGLDDAHLGHPAWSPDGQWIAFHTHAEEGARIYRVLATGGPARLIVGGSGFRYAPAFSPDGRWVLYTGSETGEDYGVRAVLVTGGGDQPVVDSPEDDRIGAWIGLRR